MSLVRPIQYHPSLFRVAACQFRLTGQLVASTVPIECWDCQTAVFYFTCTCGSRVLFLELGGEWEKHDCRVPKRAQVNSLRICLESHDARVLEVAVMRIADLAIATGSGMRIPPLPPADKFFKRKYRISFNGSFEDFFVTLINPTHETVRALGGLELPLGIDIEIDYGDYHAE